MSMRWIKGDGKTEMYTLLDSMENTLAEVFKVTDTEWHSNVLDVFYDTASSKDEAMDDVYTFIGVRPMR